MQQRLWQFSCASHKGRQTKHVVQLCTIPVIYVSFHTDPSQLKARAVWTTVWHSNRIWQMPDLQPEKHLTSGVWDAGGVFLFCCAMKQMREFVSGEPRTPTLDLRLAFSCARRDLSVRRERERLGARLTLNQVHITCSGHLYLLSTSLKATAAAAK